MTTTIIVIVSGFFVLIALLAAIVIAMYNRLVKLRNVVRSSWSDIDVQLKKRYNLVPNLVDTVKAYAKHEKSVFENVARARSTAMQTTTPAERAKSDNIFRDTLKSLFAVAEAYPELKANSNFMQLQQQFQELEEDIESARRYYNAVVRDYNTLTETFPSNLIASNFAFRPEEFYQLDAPDVQRQPPRADFT